MVQESNERWNIMSLMSIYLNDPVSATSAQTWIQFPRLVVVSFMLFCRHTRMFAFSRLFNQTWLFCLAGYLISAFSPPLGCCCDTKPWVTQETILRSALPPVSTARNATTRATVCKKNSCVGLWGYIFHNVQDLKPILQLLWCFFLCLRKCSVP